MVEGANSSFMAGFFYGVLIFSFVEVMVGLFVIFTFSRKVALRPIEKEKTKVRFPSSKKALWFLEKSILRCLQALFEARDDFTKPTAKMLNPEVAESCMWLNEFVNRLYFDHIGLENARRMVLEKILQDFRGVQGDHARVLVLVELLNKLFL